MGSVLPPTLFAIGSVVLQARIDKIYFLYFSYCYEQYLNLFHLLLSGRPVWAAFRFESGQWSGVPAGQFLWLHGLIETAPADFMGGIADELSVGYDNGGRSNHL
jgi:hypothetical protein